MNIKNIYDAVIFTSAALTLRDAVLDAINKKINLSYADLRYADLRSADLRSANLSSADLRSADLREVKSAALDIARVQFIPTEGQFIGWKKCVGGTIVKLRIPAKAKRSHGAERKCRCSEAVPVSITNAEGKSVNTAISLHDSKFIYTVGRTATPDGFDEDRWNVCGQGIHFYITREEAEAHS